MLTPSDGESANRDATLLVADRIRAPVLPSWGWSVAAICFTVLLPGMRGWAQAPPAADLSEASLEELMKIKVQSVYGASKYLQKVTQAPAAVTILDAEEIKKHGYRTLADALRSVRGLYVTYDRNYSYVGVRGFNRPGDYNTRILLLVDGHRTNENVYELTYFGTEFPIDIDLIDRIEVIRGPSSSIYGTNAFFAVVNVVTRKGANLKGAEASGELASYGTLKGRISYGAKLKNGLEVLLSGTVYDSQGHERLYFSEFDDPTTHNGFAENVDDDQYHQFFANLSYRDFTVRGVYGSREKGIPAATFGTIFNDSRSRTVDSRGWIEFQYMHGIGDTRSLTARAYYDQYEFNGSYVYDYSESEIPWPVVNKDLAHGKWWGGEVKFIQTLPGWNKLTLGSEYRRNLRQNLKNYDLDPPALYLDIRKKSTVWGLYFQDEVWVRKDLVLNLGLRHDRYPTFGGTTNPRLALIYSPLEKAAFKFLYGEAFRAPSVYEVFYQVEGFKPNAALRPEKIRTFEIVWEQYVGERFRLSASGFHYGVRDLIDQVLDSNGDLIFLNSARVDAKGVEMELEKKWAWGLESRLSYAYQDAALQNGGPLSNSPKHLGLINVSAPLAKRKAFAGFDLQYMSKRRTLAGNYAGAHAVPNFTLFSQNLLKGWEISATVYNLFGRRYGDPAGVGFLQDIIEQDGRSFRLKASYHF
jgi:iron complex outermembrane receptor protein